MYYGYNIKCMVGSLSETHPSDLRCQYFCLSDIIVNMKMQLKIILQNRG